MAKSKKAMQELEQMKAEALQTIVKGGQLSPSTSELLMSIPEFAEELEKAKAEQKVQAKHYAAQVAKPLSTTAYSIYAVTQKTAPGISQDALHSELPAFLKRFKTGDIEPIEEMLAAQAITLQVLSSQLIGQAVSITDINHKEAHLHLALKASNQLRQVLVALADIKQPRRATFIKQQLNQLNLDSKNSKKSEKRSNELLSEASNGAPVDFAGEAAASTIDQNLETVEVE